MPKDRHDNNNSGKAKDDQHRHYLNLHNDSSARLSTGTDILREPPFLHPETSRASAGCTKRHGAVTACTPESPREAVERSKQADACRLGRSGRAAVCRLGPCEGRTTCATLISCFARNARLQSIHSDSHHLPNSRHRAKCNAPASTFTAAGLARTASGLVTGLAKRSCVANLYLRSGRLDAPGQTQRHL
jgi:hypothetical protein